MRGVQRSLSKIVRVEEGEPENEANKHLRRQSLFQSPSHHLSCIQKISPIARNVSLTFIAVFAEVSMKSREFSSAYD